MAEAPIRNAAMGRAKRENLILAGRREGWSLELVGGDDEV